MSQAELKYEYLGNGPGEGPFCRKLRERMNFVLSLLPRELKLPLPPHHRPPLPNYRPCFHLSLPDFDIEKVHQHLKFCLQAPVILAESTLTAQKDLQPQPNR